MNDNFWGNMSLFGGILVTFEGQLSLCWPLYAISNPPKNYGIVNPSFLAMPVFSRYFVGQEEKAHVFKQTFVTEGFSG